MQYTILYVAITEKIIFFIEAIWLSWKKTKGMKNKKNLSVQGLIFKLHALRCEILALLKKRSTLRSI